MHLGMTRILSLGNMLVFSMIYDWEVIYLCLFAFHFFKERVNIAFQHALIFATDKKITLMRDACFKSSIIIKSHNLHVVNIKGAVGNSFLPQVG
jgi:hypothetical protein